jgi:hypothetical protein
VWLFSVVERVDEVGSGSGDSGADGAGWAVADLGGFVVAEPDYLGEDEGGSSVGLEVAEEVLDEELLVGVVRGGGRFDRMGEGLLLAMSVAGSEFVLAGVASDGEQPGSGVGLAAVGGQGTYCFEEDFLGQVAGALGVDQGGAELPHLLVGGLDELVEGLFVAAGGGVGEAAEGIHRI